MTLTIKDIRVPTPRVRAQKILDAINGSAIEPQPYVGAVYNIDYINSDAVAEPGFAAGEQITFSGGGAALALQDSAGLPAGTVKLGHVSGPFPGSGETMTSSSGFTAETSSVPASAPLTPEDLDGALMKPGSLLQFDTSNGDVSVELPEMGDASGDDYSPRSYIVRAIGAGKVIVSASAAGETVNDGASYDVASGKTSTFVGDGQANPTGNANYVLTAEV